MNNNIEMLLTNFLPNKRELPSKLVEQIAFNTRPKIEEHKLIVMDKSTDEEHLFQPLQTNNKQFKTAISSLTGFNVFFILQTKIKNSISQNQLLTEMVLAKLPHHKVVMK